MATTTLAEESLESPQKPTDTILEEKASVDTAASTVEGVGTEQSSTKASEEKEGKNEATEKKQPAKNEAEIPTKTTTPTDSIPNGPTSVPVPRALPQCIPQRQPELTSEQSEKYNQLLAEASSWTHVPFGSTRNAKPDPINDQDRLFMTRESLLRYLRATKWSPDEAAKRVRATLSWRREQGSLGGSPEAMSLENETGKQVIFGFDNEGRPCLYLIPSRQNTPRSDQQIEHLVYMLERVIELMEPGQETLALLISFKDSGPGANVAQGRQTLYILQNHYPERLGRALISELPWIVNGFFKLITPFIDPVTKSKMKFNEPLVDHVPAEQLLTTHGGKVEFEYKHDVYWPALQSLCHMRKSDYFCRWVKGGMMIGEYEAYLRGADVKCLSGEYVGSQFKEGFGLLC